MSYPNDNEGTEAYSQPFQGQRRDQYQDRDQNRAGQDPDRYAYSGSEPMIDPTPSNPTGDAAVTHYQRAQAQIADLERENNKLRPFRPIAFIAGAAALILLVTAIVIAVRSSNSSDTPGVEGATSTITQTEKAPPAEKPDPTTVTKTEKSDPTTVTKTEKSEPTTVTETETTTVTKKQAPVQEDEDN